MSGFGVDDRESSAADLGNVIHEIAANADDGQTLADLHAALDAAWERIDFAASWFADNEHERAEQMLASLASWLTSSRSRLTRVGTEVDFQVEVGDARISGRVDRLERDSDGRLVVVDLKTGQSKPKSEELPTHPQLGTYQLAIEHGAFAELGTESGGALLVQLGRPGRDRGTGAAAARGLDRPAMGAGRRGPHGGTHARRAVPGHRERPMPDLRRPHQLPGATSGSAGPVVISAADLCRLLDLGYQPTDEQAEVIESGLQPAAVIAGAGSGKTETMAARVVWLVANDLVTPEHVLGLTFTRKAAAELGKRIRHRLAQWRRVVELDRPTDLEHLAVLQSQEPTVSTYAAYAGRLVGEQALRVGAEPEARLLSPALVWQISDEVVRGWRGPLSEFRTVSSLVHWVIAMAGQFADHLVPPAQVERFCTAAARALPRPAGGQNRSTCAGGTRWSANCPAIAITQCTSELRSGTRSVARASRGRPRRRSATPTPGTAAGPLAPLRLAAPARRPGGPRTPHMSTRSAPATAAPRDARGQWAGRSPRPAATGRDGAGSVCPARPRPCE